MNTSRAIGILLSIFFCTANLVAQDYLYLLQKEGGLPVQRWKQGEKIEIEIKNGEEAYWQVGYFNGGDSAGINFGTRYIEFESIERIKVARGLLPFMAYASYSAAALFTGIFAVNAIINDDRPILRPGQIGLGLGLAGAGLLADLFAYRKYELDSHYFKIINTD